MDRIINKKIPELIPIDGYKDISIEECGEPLVKVFDNEKLKIANIYLQNGYIGAEPNCYVRETIAKMLLNASMKLPDNFVLVVNDGWRPYKLQLDIYRRMFDSVKKLHPEYSERQLHEETSKFASAGSLDPKMPSPHFTGGAVDVVLTDNAGNEYEMGSEFDDSTIESSTRFFEVQNEKGVILSIKETEALHYRRILFHCMADAGFTNYSNEWWHYDHGNQLWATIKNTKAKYGLIKP